VELDGRETKLLCNLGVFDLARLLEGEPLDALGHVGAGRDGAATAESFKLDVGDDAVGVNADLELHHVTASGSTDEACANVDVVLGQRANLFGKKTISDKSRRVQTAKNGPYISRLLVM
jgi:hypothetical protein